MARFISVQDLAQVFPFLFQPGRADDPAEFFPELTAELFAQPFRIAPQGGLGAAEPGGERGVTAWSIVLGCEAGLEQAEEFAPPVLDISCFQELPGAPDQSQHPFAIGGELGLGR